jgi:hypothetical protein
MKAIRIILILYFFILTVYFVLIIYRHNPCESLGKPKQVRFDIIVDGKNSHSLLREVLCLFFHNAKKM